MYGLQIFLLFLRYLFTLFVIWLSAYFPTPLHAQTMLVMAIVVANDVVID